MPEALARSRTDSVLSRPLRAGPGDDRPGIARIAMGRLLSQPTRTIAGATLTAILTGIVVNALVLQREPRALPPTPPPRPASAVVQSQIQPAPAPSAASPVSPPTRPASLSAPPDPPMPPSRARDSIRDLLQADKGKPSARLTLAAQNALIKLGFSIKADGVAGAATEQAIAQFERSHDLAASPEITAGLVKRLNAAAR